jgi:hypothetical protein
MRCEIVSGHRQEATVRSAHLNAHARAAREITLARETAAVTNWQQAEVCSPPDRR